MSTSSEENEPNGHMARARILAVCAGIGGMELGLKLAMPRSTVVGYIERESCAAAHLLARMEEQALEPAPVWCGDLGTFPGHEFRGCVDIITAGLPCQPYSVAGRGKGNKDPRAIWPQFIHLVESCSPSVVFLENVPRFVSAGHFRGLGEELCRMGYTIENPLFIRASDVGAPHRRERVFVLAHRTSLDWRILLQSGRQEQASPDTGRDCEVVGNAKGHGLEGRVGGPGRMRKGGQLGPWPPGPSNTDAWGSVLADRPDLAPALSIAEEYAYGINYPLHRRTTDTTKAEPELRRVADGVPGRLDGSPPTGRADRLRLAGNAVVPIQAAVAWAILSHEAIKGG